MVKYKNLEETVDLALKFTKETSKGHSFSICQGASGAEITNIQEVDSEKKCPGTKLGTFRTYPESKDETLSPKDISNIQPDVQKV